MMYKWRFHYSEIQLNIQHYNEVNYLSYTNHSIVCKEKLCYSHYEVTLVKQPQTVVCQGWGVIVSEKQTMNTKNQKQYMQNILGQLKSATSQNKALKIDLFGEHRKLSDQAGYIYRAYFFLFVLNLSFAFLLAKKLLNCSPL